MKKVWPSDNLSQRVCVCHRQSVFVTYSLRLSEIVCICVDSNFLSYTACFCQKSINFRHRQSVSVTHSLCLSDTVCVCNRHSVSVKDSVCPSETVSVCPRQSVCITNTLPWCSWPASLLNYMWFLSRWQLPWFPSFHQFCPDSSCHDVRPSVTCVIIAGIMKSVQPLVLS